MVPFLHVSILHLFGDPRGTGRIQCLNRRAPVYNDRSILLRLRNILMANTLVGTMYGILRLNWVLITLSLKIGGDQWTVLTCN